MPSIFTCLKKNNSSAKSSPPNLEKSIRAQEKAAKKPPSSGSGSIRSFLSQLSLIVSYLGEDLKRAPIQLTISIFSVFLIVAFISILANAKGLMTALFIGLAEGAVGDSDYIAITAGGGKNRALDNNSSQPGLGVFQSNFFPVEESRKNLQKIDELLGSSPRWFFPAKVFNPKDETKFTSSYALLGVSEYENSFGIGRNLRSRNLGREEAIILQSVENMAELDENLEFYMRFDAERLFKRLGVISDKDNSTDLEKKVMKQVIEQALPPNITIDLNQIKNSMINDSSSPLSAFNLTNITIQTGNLTNRLVDGLLDALTFKSKYKAIKVVKTPEGKWPDILGNVVFAESSYMFENLGKSIETSLGKQGENITNELLTQLNISVPAGSPNNIQSLIQEQLFSGVNQTISNLLMRPISDGYNSFNISDKAMALSMTARDKVAVYSSFVSYKDKLVQATNKIARALGDPSKFILQAPMYYGYQALGFVAIFIENIIYMILVLLGILAIVLLVALMIFDIEEKSYQFGMLRALGFSKKNIAIMIILQGIFLAVLGWMLGIFLAWVLSALLQIYFYLDMRIVQDINLEGTTWVLSIIFGLFMPLLVIFYSIRNALTGNLKDALDLMHRTISQVTVVFLRLERLGISRTTFVIAMVLATFGFLFYSVAPRLFYHNRFDLFVYLFNTILLSVIISLTVLGNILQGYMEKGFLWVSGFLCRKKIRPLRKIIDKNLEAHESANRKTALMISLCVSFIIFSGSGIANQVESIISAVIISNGSDLNIQASGLYLDEEKLRNFFGEDKIKPKIEGFSFISIPLRDFPFVKSIKLTPKSNYPSFSANIVGIDQNFSKVFYSQYYLPEKYSKNIEFDKLKNGKKDGFGGIFKGESLRERVLRDPNQVFAFSSHQKSPIKVNKLIIKMAIPTSLVEHTGMDVDIPAQLRILSLSTIRADVKLIHSAKKAPGLLFSDYIVNLLNDHNLPITTEAFGAFVNSVRSRVASKNQTSEVNLLAEYESEKLKKSTFQVPKKILLVKFKDNLSEEDRDVIKNGLKNQLSSEDVVIDAIKIKNTTKSSLIYLKYLNVVIATLTCLISFFILLISLVKKIKDNIWELGVMRAIGINTQQVYWVYGIETGGLIISAFFIGTLVGILISLIGSVFLRVFLEVNLGLLFPYTEFFILLGFLIITTLVTSYFGLKSFVYKPIGSLLKGLN